MSYIIKGRDSLRESVIQSSINQIPSHIKRKIKSLERKDQLSRTIRLSLVQSH